MGELEEAGELLHLQVLGMEESTELVTEEEQMEQMEIMNKFLSVTILFEVLKIRAFEDPISKTTSHLLEQYLISYKTTSRLQPPPPPPQLSTILVTINPTLLSVPGNTVKIGENQGNGMEKLLRCPGLHCRRD